MAAVGEMVAKPEGWEVISSEERESARLEEVRGECEWCLMLNATRNRDPCQGKHVRRHHFYPLTDGVKESAVTDVP